MPSDVTLNWSGVSPPVSPPPLAYASAVYDSDNRTIVLFGGEGSGGTLSNDTWVWNGSTWTEYSSSQVQAPPPRDKAAMAFDPALHELILFGGQGANGQPLDDTWAWNGASWYEEAQLPNSPWPSAREGAAMTYDGAGQLVLFGGSGPGPSTPAEPASTPSTTTTSTTVPPTGGGSTTPPVSATTPATTGPTTGSDVSGSTGASNATASPASSGGSESPVTLGDTWLWSSAGWTQVEQTGPSPRSGAAMVFDPSSGAAVLFGGDSSTSSTGSPGLLDDTWAWKGGAWSRLTTPVAPPGREAAAIAADGLPDQLVLFGGLGAAGVLGDTWLWNGRSWNPADIPGTTTARAGAAAAFDSATNQLLLFGGLGSDNSILSDTVILADQPPVPFGSGSATTPTPVPQTTPTSTAPSLPHRAGFKPTRGATKLTPGSTLSTTSSPSTSPLVATGHTLHRGALVRLSGHGFNPGAAITITFHSTAIVVGSAVADATGDFSVTVAVPELASAGTHRFEASGRGPAGELNELIATVRVVGVPHPGSSATAVQTIVLTGVALLLPLATWYFLAGAGWWRRRRAPVTQR
jgi:Galactose oxidase, central domain